MSLADPDDLTPSNASPLERELARMSARLDAIDPSVIETIWDAWRCPAALLPWLAWAMSVDTWDDTWPEVTRRQAIADSPAYHRIKGTRAAVESALALSGFPFELTEWFERLPEGRRGTATAFIESPLDRIAATISRVAPLVRAAKPKSRAVAIVAGERQSGTLVIGAGLHDETLTTINPYAYEGENVDGAFVIGAGLHVEELIEIGTAA